MAQHQQDVILVHHYLLMLICKNIYNRKRKLENENRKRK